MQAPKNECFPYSINTGKMLRIEKELMRQLAVLEDEVECYKERGESELWTLRCCERENQLQDIRCELDKVEYKMNDVEEKLK